MAQTDEPSLGIDSDLGSAEAATEPSLPERIRALVERQLYGVLCTQGEGQPYGSLVAFAFGPDLASAAFCTPTATRKYRLLTECDRVALLVDNRPDHLDDMSRVEAITATGRAVLLEGGAEFERWRQRLVTRHAPLAAFFEAPSVALLRIDIARFFHVVRFQEVRQWIPAPAG
jgi:nitroimidazol reductase NimA-like FMN-containing flavoprotein (pyridoxamine 5'-phosphate oxidase superfamily)